MLDKVIEVLSHYTDDDVVIEENSDLVADLGLSSFDLLNAVTEFEEEFDVDINEDELLDLKTVNDIVEYIDRLN